jgi:hypothetical protein
MVVSWCCLGGQGLGRVPGGVFQVEKLVQLAEHPDLEVGGGGWRMKDG